MSKKWIVGAALALAALAAVLSTLPWQAPESVLPPAQPVSMPPERGDNSAQQMPRIVDQQNSIDAGDSAADHLSSVEVGAEQPNPTAVYLANLDAAHAGDAHSQYRVYRAIRDCNQGARTEQDIERIEREGFMDEEFVGSLRSKFETCRGLFGLVPEPEEAENNWYRAAVTNGSPVALARAMMLDFENHDRDEIRHVIREALKTGDAEAYLYAASYQGKLVREGASPVYYTALTLMQCAADAGCDESGYRKELYEMHPVHEFEQIVSLAENGERLIAAGDFAGLGF